MRNLKETVANISLYFQFERLNLALQRTLAKHKIEEDR